MWLAATGLVCVCIHIFQFKSIQIAPCTKKKKLIKLYCNYSTCIQEQKTGINQLDERTTFKASFHYKQFNL
jgi:3,4-dihydroxy-2-butanone 4-phosphate synthase